MHGDSVRVQCPHCFERVEIWLEADVEGEMIQDCEVCCRPWQLWVRWRADGSLEVDIRRAY